MSAMQADLEMVTWLRSQVEARKATAEAATCAVPWEAEGDDPTDDEVWIDVDGQEWRLVILRGPDSHENMLHVAANDPRDTIARCEMELAVLDGHYILHREDRSEVYEEFSVVRIGGADKDCGCVTCHYYGQGGVKGHGICYTVRRIALGYRHWPGWKEEWGAWHSTSPSTSTG
jgi:Family of unknown function (DUF6221)